MRVEVVDSAGVDGADGSGVDEDGFPVWDEGVKKGEEDSEGLNECLKSFLTILPASRC